MQIIEIIGWIGAILLATCGLPQLFKTLKTKNFDGLSLTFILWGLAGEILTLVYITNQAFKLPLLFNYGINIIICITILIFYIKKK